MSRRAAREAARADFLPLVRELARAYQAFATFGAHLLRARGLTAAQADVLFTLGNTEGMTFGELGERTLITKGTLTGVVDRLEIRGWVQRVPLESDRRCTLAVLTDEGQRLFEEAFPRHIAEVKTRFDRMPLERQAEARQVLGEIRELFGPT